MEKLDIKTSKIGVWSHGNNSNSLSNNHLVRASKTSLIDFIKLNGIESVPRVPIFRLENNFPHEYVLIDGHRRRFAANKLELLLPCNVYNPDEKIDIKKEGIDALETDNSGGEIYSIISGMYINCKYGSEIEE